MNHSNYIRFQDGFLDDLTIRALKQAEGCTNSRISDNFPLTGTMWYDARTGTIYGFGNGKPPVVGKNENIMYAKVLFNENDHEPLPLLFSFFEHIRTPALATALGSIKEYRKAKGMSLLQ